ncbi:hypothetical protein ACFFHH_05695 [Cytobacillus solani]|nr:hypothetical protein [Cytobacillus solani]USK53046.1 hypothetical protein LIS82_15620 [Cytobacillus solani]
MTSCHIGVKKTMDIEKLKKLINELKSKGVNASLCKRPAIIQKPITANGR